MTKKDEDFDLDELFNDEDEDNTPSSSKKKDDKDDEIDFEPTFDDEPEFDGFEDDKTSKNKSQKNDDDDFGEIEVERNENIDDDDDENQNDDEEENKDDDGNQVDSDDEENQENVVQKTSFMDKYKKYLITGVSLIAVTAGVYFALPYAMNMFSSGTTQTAQTVSQPPLVNEQAPPVQAPIRKKGNLNAENNQQPVQPQLGEQANAQAPVVVPGPVITQTPDPSVVPDAPVIKQNEQPQIGSAQQAPSMPNTANVPVENNQPVIVEQNSVPNPVVVPENVDNNNVSSKIELLSSDVARLNQNVSDLTNQLSNMNLTNLIGGLDMLNREVQTLKANNNQEMIAKIQVLEEKIANLEKRLSAPRRNTPTKTNVRQNTNSQRTTANLNSEGNSSKVVLETKPKPAPVPQKSIKGYKLLGATINGDVASAILTDGSETKKVFIGDELPKVGKVKSIFMNNNNWFVETESGIIKYK